jgi:uncharacterized membrane protein YkvA (DUF1232 family)
MLGRMWLIVAVIGLAIGAAVVGGMALAARALPPGRGREMVGLLPNCLVLLRRLRATTGLPPRARLALGAALAYLVSPIQLIPNLIPVIGQSDDLLAVTLAVRCACRSVPSDEARKLWPGDPAVFDRLFAPRRSKTAP